NYQPYSLFHEKQIINKVKVLDGKKKEISISPFKSASIPLSEGEDEKLLTVLDIPKSLNAPIEKGQRVGKMTTYLDGKVMNTTYLIADESVEQLTLKDNIKNFFGIGQ